MFGPVSVAVGALIIAAATSSFAAGEILERSIQQPLDHFSASHTPHFMQRYYVNNQYYRFGGPVLVYSVGERTASELDLSDGWIDELAKRTNGLSVLLEQRFYGGSIPGPLVGDGLSDSAMWRYLTVEQMMADVKQFVEQAGTIPELTHSTLRHGRALAPLSVVLVGGSFAGSLMAWTKHQYPNLEALVISSSAPLNIVDDFWEFDKMAAQRLPCAKTLSQVIRAIDEAIDRGNATHIAELQRRFGLENVDTAGFVSALTIQVSSLMQAPVGTQTVDPVGIFCSKLEPPALATQADSVEAFAHMTREFGQHRRIKPASGCPEPGDNLAWLWQQCTELGMWQTSPQQNSSNVDEASWFLQRLRSRLLNTQYYEQQCSRCLPATWQGSDMTLQKARFRIFSKQALSAFTMNGQHSVSGDVLLTAGELDPWLYLTAARPGISQANNVVVIRNASHAEDLLGSSDEDDMASSEVQNARRRIIDAVEQWSMRYVRGYRRGTKVSMSNRGGSKWHQLRNRWPAGAATALSVAWWWCLMLMCWLMWW